MLGPTLIFRLFPKAGEKSGNNCQFDKHRFHALKFHFFYEIPKKIIF